MVVVSAIAIVCCGFVFMWILPRYLKVKKQKQENDLFKEIMLSVLSADVKTRKQIEKMCKDYQEHKVINQKNASDNYTKQINLILDTIKYFDVITSVEPIEPKEKELSKIEKAIENNKKVEKLGKSKKEEKANG